MTYNLPMTVTDTRLPRLRLKSDGRVVEILPDGRERPVPEQADAPPSRLAARLARLAPPGLRQPKAAAQAPAMDAAYARRVRAATGLTQAEFAARIGVPIETLRNWEQGKRAPRGPARALLKVIESAPDLVFAALAPSPRR